VLATAFGLTRRVAIEVGLLLGQGGEFVFVVVGLAMSLGVVPATAGQFMLIVASMSMLVTPLVAGLAARAGRASTRTADRTAAGAESIPDQGLEGHVLIAGFGRVGQALARVFDGETLPYLALDLDSAAVAGHRTRGLPVYFGDASRPDILRRAGVEHARALVVTMDSPEAARRTVEAARRAWPWLPIFARARDVPHASLLVASGATRVVPETVESSLQLAARVLEGLGVPDEAIGQAVEEQRALELGVIARGTLDGRGGGTSP